MSNESLVDGKEIVAQLGALLEAKIETSFARLQGELHALKIEREHGDNTLGQKLLVQERDIRNLQVDIGRLSGTIETVRGDSNRAYDAIRADIREGFASLQEGHLQEMTATRKEFNSDLARIREEAQRALDDELNRHGEKTGEKHTEVKTVVNKNAARIEQVERKIDRATWILIGGSLTAGVSGGSAAALLLRAFAG